MWSAFYSAGLRPSLHPVFGSIFLREASRKGAFLHSDRLTPCIHQSGASCPAPSRYTSRGETGGKNPTGSVGAFLLHVPYARVLGRFSTRKGGCSVVCGGWRLKAGVVAKMVKWWWCCWRCGSVLGVVAYLVAVVVCVEVCCNGGRDMSVQNNDSNRKTYLKESQPDESRRIPSKQRWGNLSEHRLTGITDLGTFMM